MNSMEEISNVAQAAPQNDSTTQSGVLSESDKEILDLLDSFQEAQRSVPNKSKPPSRITCDDEIRDLLDFLENDELSSPCGDPPDLPRAARAPFKR